jgi:anti-anti-sigma factor
MLMNRLRSCSVAAPFLCAFKRGLPMRAAHDQLPIRRTDGHTVVEMPTEIDASNSDDVRAQLLELLNSGTGPVVIDLTGTAFCDSSTLRALIRARTRAMAVGRPLHTAVTPAGAVYRVFKLTALSRLIPTHDDVDTAVKAAMEEAA